MHVSNLRCDASHNGQRCAKTMGHSGWHQDGVVEWVTQTQRRTMAVCRVVIDLDGRRVACTEPEGHRGAHRGQNLIWTDATPPPEEL